MLQMRGRNKDTLLFDCMCLASDWFKITMGHEQGCDWYLKHAWDGE